jgi:hypothetical protein
MEVQFKTWDQQPLQANPPAGCDQNTTSCYNFPAARKAAVPSATPTTVNVPLASASSWSATNAAQLVGLQWQWTGSGCPIDVDITGIRFVNMTPTQSDGGTTDAATPASDGGTTDSDTTGADAGTTGADADSSG